MTHQPNNVLRTFLLVLTLAAVTAPTAWAACDNWSMVFRHDSTGGTFFANQAEALRFNADKDPRSVQKFSRLNELDNLRGADGKLHFKLAYPGLGTAYNEWKQTSNPVTTSERVDGYEGLTTAWATQHWDGLAKSSHGSTFIDGSVGHRYWYYSIGSNRAWGNGIPGPNGAVTEVELYVCGSAARHCPVNKSFSQADHCNEGGKGKPDCCLCPPNTKWSNVSANYRQCIPVS